MHEVFFFNELLDSGTCIVEENKKPELLCNTAKLEAESE